MATETATLGGGVLLVPGGGLSGFARCHRREVGLHGRGNA